MAPAPFAAEACPAQSGAKALRLAGRLAYLDADRLRLELERFAGEGASLELDLEAVESLDGGAAAVLADAWAQAQARGAELRFAGGSPKVRAVLALYTARPPRQCFLPERRRRFLEVLGRWTLAALSELRQLLEYTGEGVMATLAALRRPRTVDWKALPRQAERAGADALPIVLLISALIGLITAFQAAVQLRKFGADIFITDLVALSIARELGPLMTAIVIAGRSGAGLAAELGTMRVSEEIDALRALGLCPFRTLVFPRVLSLVLMVPLLVLLADIVGIAAGLPIATGLLELSAHGYVSGVRDALVPWDVGGGLLKALFFGFLIGFVACERGLATRGGAEGVGRAATSSVVAILFALIAADAVFAVLYNDFGI